MTNEQITQSAIIGELGKTLDLTDPFLYTGDPDGQLTFPDVPSSARTYGALQLHIGSRVYNETLQSPDATRFDELPPDEQKAVTAHALGLAAHHAFSEQPEQLSKIIDSINTATMPESVIPPSPVQFEGDEALRPVASAFIRLLTTDPASTHRLLEKMHDPWVHDEPLPKPVKGRIAHNIISAFLTSGVDRRLVYDKTFEHALDADPAIMELRRAFLRASGNKQAELSRRIRLRLLTASAELLLQYYPPSEETAQPTPSDENPAPQN